MNKYQKIVHTLIPKQPLRYHKTNKNGIVSLLPKTLKLKLHEITKTKLKNKIIQQTNTYTLDYPTSHFLFTLN